MVKQQLEQAPQQPRPGEVDIDIDAMLAVKDAMPDGIARPLVWLPGKIGNVIAWALVVCFFLIPWWASL